jgi:histidinol-phosphate aminotransferase
MLKKSVKEMSAYSAPTEDRTNFKRFDFNEATIQPSPKVKEAIKKFLESNQLNTYPHDYPLLHEKIAKYLNVDKDCIRITDGADGAIEAISLAYLENGDRVIIPSPSFGMFYIPTVVAGAVIVKPEYGPKMEFPTQEVLKEIDTKPKLIILCNPNNPTGTLIKREDIIKILDKAKESIVLLDEVYAEFAKATCADLIKDYPNLFIIRSFSKAFSLASLRVGYIISNPKNILEINKVVAPYNVNQIAVVSALAALDDLDYMKNYVDEVMNKSKPLFEEYLKKNNIKFYPSWGNFLLVEVGDSKKVYEALREKGVLIRPQKARLASCARITIGTLKDTKEFIELFDKILKDKV